MAAIEILGLEKTYMVGFWKKRPKRALQPLHLTVEPGEIFGFLGPNGAGKTTTMRMLTCFLPPTSGSATVAGYDVLEHPLEVKRRIGYLPETPPLYPEMRVEEYLHYRAKLKGVERAQRTLRAARSSCRTTACQCMTPLRLDAVAAKLELSHEPTTVPNV